MDQGKKKWIAIGIGIAIILGGIIALIVQGLSAIGTPATHPEKFYSKYIVDCYLREITGNEQGLAFTEQDKQGFNLEDARVALKTYLDIDYTSLSDESIIAFVKKGKKDRILSMDEIHLLYGYFITDVGNSAVSTKEIFILDVIFNEQGNSYVVTVEGNMPILALGQGDQTQNEQKRLETALEELQDSTAEVYTLDGNLIGLIGADIREMTLPNVWIEGADYEGIHVFIKGYRKTYPCGVEAKEYTGYPCLADLEINAKGVCKVKAKTDVICAKVLAVNDTGVELEGYGTLALSPYYQIYKIYGELAVEPSSQILVGYKQANFVVADGVIEAALITEPVVADHIRVVIGNQDYSGYHHDVVQITSDEAFVLEFNGESKTFEAESVLELSLDCGYMSGGRVKICPSNEGKLQILNLNRNGYQPRYRGTLEVAPGTEGGLYIVNELSLEEYLYTVIPSEMPTSYGEESLKVQAICARGYAYAKIHEGSYAQYGAHVDDSTKTQVYNSVEENEAAIFAVKDTYGLVPFYQGKVIDAYFFSTSCGTTCTNADVWEGEALPYLPNQIQGDTNKELKLEDESAFRHFMDYPEEYNLYEQDYPLFRWSITYTKEEMTQAIANTLATRYQANPNRLLTLQPDGTYASQEITDLGQVVEVAITKRGESGIVKEITVKGTKATIKATGQANARSLLSPAEVIIKKNDGSESVNWNMVPSPFYYIQEDEEGNIVLRGGGFGHGVGMSQNGTKSLVEQGLTTEEIIKHYYHGVELVNVYTGIPE